MASRLASWRGSPTASGSSSRRPPEPTVLTTTARSAGVPPDFVTRRPDGFYWSLNPTTRLVLAFSEALVAFLVRGWTGPISMLVVVLGIGVAAGLGRRLAFFAAATIPLVASILIVNTFLFPGATDTLFRIGPFDATGTGLTAALQATLRVVAFALSVALFSLTTRTEDLLADVEHRGIGRRAVFVVGAAIATVPRMRERAAEIAESQRARGLDTEGSIVRRARGIVPIAGPMVGGALAEVEERTMALEARGFSASARRATLRRSSDPTGQRVARWTAFVAALGVSLASLAGVIHLP